MGLQIFTGQTQYICVVLIVGVSRGKYNHTCEHVEISWLGLTMLSELTTWETLFRM